MLRNTVEKGGRSFLLHGRESMKQKFHERFRGTDFLFGNLEN